MKITREVVTDLWPLYLSGEASADTRVLVDEFLEQDPAFALLIRANGTSEFLKPVSMELKPDEEMRSFVMTRKAILHYNMNGLLFLAILFTCFAFGRIVADTSWDASPRTFIVIASIAAAFWIAFFVHLARGVKRGSLKSSPITFLVKVGSFGKRPK